MMEKNKRRFGRWGGQARTEKLPHPMIIPCDGLPVCSNFRGFDRGHHPTIIPLISCPRRISWEHIREIPVGILGGQRDSTTRSESQIRMFRVYHPIIILGRAGILSYHKMNTLIAILLSSYIRRPPPEKEKKRSAFLVRTRGRPAG